MGTPKALLHDADGTGWLARAVAALAPCDDVVVVLGASAEEVAALLPSGVRGVVAEDWEDGMGASLRAGLHEVSGGAYDAALVTLVDLPDVDAAVVGRVLAAHEGPSSLARAAYDGVPGHPVLLGQEHWEGVVASADGDRGARDYLAGVDVLLVECGDLATGRDVDTRDQSSS